MPKNIGDWLRVAFNSRSTNDLMTYWSTWTTTRRHRGTNLPEHKLDAIPRQRCKTIIIIMCCVGCVGRRQSSVHWRQDWRLSPWISVTSAVATPPTQVVGKTAPASDRPPPTSQSRVLFYWSPAVDPLMIYWRLVCIPLRFLLFFTILTLRWLWLPTLAWLLDWAWMHCKSTLRRGERKWNDILGRGVRRRRRRRSRHCERCSRESTGSPLDIIYSANCNIITTLSSLQFKYKRGNELFDIKLTSNSIDRNVCVSQLGKDITTCCDVSHSFAARW